MRFNIFLITAVCLMFQHVCGEIAFAQDKADSESAKKSTFDAEDLDSILDFDWEELRDAGASFSEVRKNFNQRAKAALKLAEAKLKTADAKRALKFICMNPVSSEVSTKAIQLFAESYSMDSDVGEVVNFLFPDEVLSNIEQNHPSTDVRLIASYVLAEKQLQQIPMWRGWTEENLPALRAIEKKMTNIRSKGADIKYRGQTLGLMTEGFLQRAKTQFPGTKMIELAGDGLDGNLMKLSDHQGKVVMISCWASWCTPCRRLFPFERDIVEKYKDEPFVFLGINGDENKADAMKFVDNGSVTWKSFWLEESMYEHPIMQNLAINAWPTTFLLDQNGVVRFVNPKKDGIEATIDELLKEMVTKE